MVRYKVAPPPRGVDALFAVRDALPLVPGSVEDCCTRIRDRTGVPSRDAAREWLTFCQALGLAAETDRGYHRTREEPATPVLADRLLEAVFPARELREVLVANGPLSAGEAFDRVREDVPRWERSRSSEWESDWRERVDHLLGWFEVVGIAETGPDGYRLAR
jgi:hypothetical protein